MRNAPPVVNSCSPNAARPHLARSRETRSAFRTCKVMATFCWIESGANDMILSHGEVKRYFHYSMPWWQKRTSSSSCPPAKSSTASTVTSGRAKWACSHLKLSGNFRLLLLGRKEGGNSYLTYEEALFKAPPSCTSPKSEGQSVCWNFEKRSCCAKNAVLEHGRVLLAKTRKPDHQCVFF